MAQSKYVGLITCPICGNESATVHEQQTGTKRGRLYYRCYSQVNGSVMLCGTIQCIGQSGQKFINENIRPIGQAAEPVRPIAEPVPVAEPVAVGSEPEPIAEPVAVEVESGPIAEPVAVAPRRGLLAYLTQEVA